MATFTPASETLSGEGIKNVPRSDCSTSIDPKCLDTPLNSFFINFATFAVADQIFHLQNITSPLLNHIFSSLTHVSEATDSNPFSVPSSFSVLIFIPKLFVVSICAMT